MDVTLFGMVIDASDEQFSKALFPMDVTLFGMVIDTSDEQPLKLLSPMDVTFVKYLNSSKEVIVVLPLKTVPIVVTVAASV